MDISLAERQRNAEEQLEALSLEGMEGPETAMTLADWEAIRKEAGSIKKGPFPGP